jgi:hypothetical protein
MLENEGRAAHPSSIGTTGPALGGTNLTYVHARDVKHPG